MLNFLCKYSYSAAVFRLLGHLNISFIHFAGLIFGGFVQQIGWHGGLNDLIIYYFQDFERI